MMGALHLSIDNLLTVTLEQLTQFYMHKQFLASGDREAGLRDVVNTLCGLHAQNSLTPYLSLWNRIRCFKSELLDTALHKEKSLVKTWCMRGTLHIIQSQDLLIYHNALKRMWFEHHGRYMRPPEWPSIEQRQRVIYPQISKALAEGPLTRKQLSDVTRQKLGDMAQFYQRLFSGWGGILKDTAYSGLTVCATSHGKEACFARTDLWLPNVNLNEIGEKQSKEQLLLRYLQGYGPASLQDFSYWSGLLAGEARATFEGARFDLAEIRVKNCAKALFVLKCDLKRLEEPNLSEESSVCLLPKFDPYLLGHKNRARIVNSEHMKLIYRPAGDIAACLLLNGRIVGTWVYRKSGKKLTIMITPFCRLGKNILEQVEHGIKDMGSLFGVQEAKIMLRP